jgi:hypothetical protein
MDERSARLAENEAVFRAANDAIDGNLAETREEELPYLCECGVSTCFQRVLLARHEYAAVRSHPARFFVVPGHEDLSAGEVVIEQTSRYSVVEKVGDVRKIVDRNDPGSSRGR